MKCCRLTTPGASVWVAVFSWHGGSVQGPHTEMWRSSGRLHHRGRYPSLHLNCVTLAVFPPVRHPAADEHQFTRDTVTGPPSGIATPNNARADLNPHLVVSPLVFSQSITVTSTYFSALISYMTEIGGKSIPIKTEVAAPAPVQEEDIWGGNNRPHSLRRYLSTLLVTEQRRRLLWLSFLTSVPPLLPPSNQNNNKVRGDAVLSAVVAGVRCYDCTSIM